MFYQELEKKMDRARQSLTRSTSKTIIELCKQYLAILAEYRSQLYELQGKSDIDLQFGSHSSCEAVRDARNVVRAALEKTTQERNRAERLLLSFTGATRGELKKS